uniref:Uncharacterized protein n=1 Tax=viral metagenome TaxID=1070528 RepID=A0A6C0HB90_9ZZZZ
MITKRNGGVVDVEYLPIGFPIKGGFVQGNRRFPGEN